MMRISILIISIFYLTTSQAAFTSHFKTWLSKNYSFLLNDYASYGGKKSDKDALQKIPTILIHGNSDLAITKDFPNTSNKFGWNNLILEFKKQGYQTNEIYAFTWGNANPKHAQYNYHSYKNLRDIRSFILAVKKYTGAKSVNIVSHSMGVTLSQGAIIGGEGADFALPTQKYNLGEKLDFINNFIGISGANYGLKNCYATSFYPVCSKTNGFYPLSNYLRRMNKHTGRIAKKIYSICSMSDEILGEKLEVLGKNTCFLKNQNGNVLFTKLKLSHFETKTKTTSEVINYLN